jgi:hypothetical protein
MNLSIKSTSRILIALLAGGLGLAQAEEASFYKAEPLFSTAPKGNKSLQTIARFGPVGIGIDLIHPVFTMRIKNVEEGLSESLLLIKLIPSHKKMRKRLPTGLPR